jgi:hypothetical protein
MIISRLWMGLSRGREELRWLVGLDPEMEMEMGRESSPF